MIVTIKLVDGERWMRGEINSPELLNLSGGLYPEPEAAWFFLWVEGFSDFKSDMKQLALHPSRVVYFRAAAPGIELLAENMLARSRARRARAPVPGGTEVRWAVWDPDRLARWARIIPYPPDRAETRRVFNSPAKPL